MRTEIQLRQHTGCLQLALDSGEAAVPLIDRELPLSQVVERLGDHPYVLVSGGDGRIAGVVSTERICERLESANPIERRRWQQMPLNSLLEVSFAQSADRPTVTARESMECVAVTEGNEILGLIADDDVFLSWRRIESLVSVALSDPLTGLLNRLAWERRVTEEWSRAARTGMSIGVVVVDLDGFKNVNDTLGHPAGDAVLCAIGHELESSMRSYDVVARLGGDEFVALCLDCSAGDIAIPIGRIHQGIAELQLEYQGTEIPVTASIGAAVRHGGFDTSDPRELFAAADACLYHAKASAETAWKVEIGGKCSGTMEPVRLATPQGTGRRSNPAHSTTRPSKVMVTQSGENL